MCGILGFCSNQVEASALNTRSENALKLMSRRGPNASCFKPFNSDNWSVGLGHTRLSIIDLSPGGNQPMVSSDGNFVITYNGEIYNFKELRFELQMLGHKFSSDSDTEVLLLAWMQWGIKALKKFRGMFAFAIFDRIVGKVTLARDAFGIKPLFYKREPHQIYFASEIPVLLEMLDCKPKLNLKRAYEYLVFGEYDSSKDTFYENIFNLPPGYYLELDLDGDYDEIPKPWWFPSIQERKDLTFEDAANQIREMFLNNIRLHLRSDVSLGAALSGGIDSSAIVCAMRHLEPQIPIHTFSFISPGSPYDESGWIDKINQYAGGISHAVQIQPSEVALDLDDMIKAQGEPFGGMSIYAQYRVFRLARENGITVTLDGQGADELFSGYSRHVKGCLRTLRDKKEYFKMAKFLCKWSTWPTQSAKRAILELGDVFIPKKARKFAFGLIGYNAEPSWLQSDWLHDQKFSMNPPPQEELSQEGEGRRLVELLRSELTGSGLAQLLRHGDRNSMHWSVESRVPFLTHDIAEFTLSLPESYLLSSRGQTKSIFREAMRGIVPNQVLNRRDKIAFSTPENLWLRSLKGQLGDWLSDADHLPFLNGDACRQEVNRLVGEQRKLGSSAWRLINFCRWAQLQGVQV